MSTYSTSSGWSSNKPTYATTQDGGTVALKDSSVYLLKGGSVPGGETNKASASTWPTSNGSTTYGSSSDLWGAAWVGSDVDASNFGVRIAATDSSTASSETANVDYVSVTVSYTPIPAGIGTSAVPINQLNVAGTCQLNTNAAHSPCSSVDDTYATGVTTTAAGDNAALVMPSVDFSYWYANAKPGPKHFCTNPNPGISPSFFDNNTTLDGSLTLNGEMAGEPKGTSQNYQQNWAYDTNTPNIDYDCQVWSGGGTSGTLLGELAWNHTTHVMKIDGTVFIDGEFRFDNDGNVIHYFGRGDLIASKEDEIDSVVCAGGTGTDLASSCLTDMSNWDPSQNMMVLMADTAASWNSRDSDRYEEYDQGSTTCTGSPTTCYDGYRPGAFQGIFYSNGECLIHQEFQDSGPVICATISIPNESGKNPTFSTFPYTGDLTDGQTYAGVADTNYFEIQPGTTSG